MSGKFVQQQMYTRERGGIFHATDGYDTVAISDGLDKAFVKKYLHPFCFYQSPKNLTERGEKDASLYPPAVTLFQPETGDLVLGQAVFVPADFTGQRSSYFMHNYIVPGSRKNEWMKEPSKLFQLNEFASSYDVGLGKVLPERETVGHGDRDVLADEILAELGVSESQFKQLLFAVMASIAGKKKVFISLPVAVKDYTEYALRLLELLYTYLPYAHRRKLGALTFSSEPVGKNYINVMFYEPGTLNLADRSIEKQFIFDFACGKISGAAIEGQLHEYLDFALLHYNKGGTIDDFFEFAEASLSGLSDEQKLELASYYQLTAIYLTLQYRDLNFYNKNKIGFLHSLMKFLQANSDEKPLLYGLFVKLLREEKAASDPVQALDYVKTVFSFYNAVKSDEALEFILKTLEHYQEDPFFHQLWKAIEQDKLSFQAVLSEINGQPEYQGLLELYLDERLKNVLKTADILSELKIMLGSPYLLSNETFKAVAIKKTASAISYEANPFKAVEAVKEFALENQTPEFNKFKNDLLAHAKGALLQAIRLNDLTLQDVLSFGKIFPKEHSGMKDESAKRNFMIVHGLYQLLSSPSQAGHFNMRALMPVEREQLKEILQKFLRNKITADYFPLLLIAFATQYDEIDYPSLFEHIIRYGDEKTVMSFIRTNTLLINQDLSYKRSLRKYLIHHPKSIWKNKEYRRQLKLIRSGNFKNLLEEVDNETAHPVVKFLRDHGLKLSIGVVLTGAVVGSGWFGYEQLFGEDKPAAPAKTAETAAGSKSVPEKEKKGETAASPITLEQFKGSTAGVEAGQTFMLNLDGKQGKNIVGQPKGVTLNDINGGKLQLNVKTGFETSPFEGNGNLKAGFSLSGIEYDFDPLDENYEIVLFAKNEAAESYLWVYSIKTNGISGTTEQLAPIYQREGISGVKLEGKELIVPIGDKEETYEYSNLKKDSLEKQ